MCSMRLVSACVRMLLLVVSLALSLFMPNMLVGLAVWPLIWLVWDRLPDHERMSTPSLLELLPFAIAGQVALDSLVPYFGDVAVLVVNVMIVAALRRSKLPQARVISSREPAAARAASTCEAARRAS